MPMLRNRHPTPIIREVTPADVGVKVKNAASAPISPKAVRFASTEGYSQALADESLEDWSLKNFESHAKTCDVCHANYRAGDQRRLCPQNGAGLAITLSAKLEYEYPGGEIYTTSADGDRVRLEIPSHKYRRAREYLRAYTKRHLPRTQDKAEPQLRPNHSHRRAEPVIEHSTAPAVRPHQRYHDHYTEAIVTPSNTEREKHSSRSKHKSKRYSTIVLQDNVEDDIATSSTTTRTSSNSVYRGSLYDHNSEMRRLQRHNDYLVEVVEPDDREHRRDGKEHRRSGYYL